jgi:hypothetical protein
MGDPHAAGVQGDARRARKTGPVQTVPDDRASPRGQLDAKLVASSRRGLEFDERHLAGATDHSRTHIGWPGGEARSLGVVVIP